MWRIVGIVTSGVLTGIPPYEPRTDGSERVPDGAGGLQIVDPVDGQSLVETIVGNVTGAFFGG